MSVDEVSDYHFESYGYWENGINRMQTKFGLSLDSDIPSDLEMKSRKNFIRKCKAYRIGEEDKLELKVNGDIK